VPLGKGRQREHAFAPDPQPGPARHDHLEQPASGEQLADLRGGVHHLLEVIEHEQELTFTQSANESIANADASDPKARRGGRDHGIWFMDRCKGYPRNAVGELILQLDSDCGGQSGLANTAWASKRQQAVAR
jgi:hypothetical protein